MQVKFVQIVRLNSRPRFVRRDMSDTRDNVDLLLCCRIRLTGAGSNRAAVRAQRKEEQVIAIADTCVRRDLQRSPTYA